jgi:hypothetical protein
MIRFNVMTIGKSSAALCGAAGLLALGNTAQAQTNVKTATLTPQAAQQLSQVSQAGIPIGTASYAEMLALDAGRRQNTVDIAGRDYPFAIRLGAMLSPRIKFVGGADLTVPSLGIGHNWVGRFDAEAIVSANFGGNSTVVPLTFDEVYFRPYAGLGVGPYIASTTRFGGKLFVGARFSQRISGEGSLHFSGAGDPLFVLQVRTSL